MASSSCIASPTAAGAALFRPRRPRFCRVACSAADAGGRGGGSAELEWLLAARKNAGRVACGVLAAWSVLSASNPVIAASQVGRLPLSYRHEGGFLHQIDLSHFARIQVSDYNVMEFQNFIGFCKEILC
jgi:hypothetical protein